jgi:hypothetical protein
MKERKAAYYMDDLLRKGLVFTYDVYGIFKSTIDIGEAKKNNLLPFADFNKLSYSEKQKIAKNTIIAEKE